VNMGWTLSTHGADLGEISCDDVKQMEPVQHSSTVLEILTF
jgi:hypothetical protein